MHDAFYNVISFFLGPIYGQYYATKFVLKNPTHKFNNTN